MEKGAWRGRCGVDAGAAVRFTMTRLRLAHVITELDVGGTQRALHALLSRLPAERYRIEVGSLGGRGLFAERIESLGIPVHDFGMRWEPSGALRGVIRLVGWLRDLSPDIVHTWLYHADLVGGLAAFAAGRIPTIWAIRNGRITRERMKRRTWWTARACAALSDRLPTCIVANSESARAWHQRFGYARARFAVIPNGFDVDRFRPDPAARHDVRRELGLDDATFVIGLIANDRPEKDHATFARAAGAFAAARPTPRFVLCGKGVDPGNAALARLLADAGVSERCHLLGVRRDVHAVAAAVDVITLSSRVESLPNALGEAMACGVPAVVTDVGDCARVVGDTGLVVPAGAPERLAEAWERMAAMEESSRKDLGARARARIESCYGMARMVSRHQELYRRVARDVRDRRSA